MTDISAREAHEHYGISASHEEMPNGERRFRLTDRDGLGYIRTEAGASGGWQNAHLHQTLIETYIVQQGWIAAAELKQGIMTVAIFTAGNIWSSVPGTVHNVYMAGNAVTHTVKHGAEAAGDWLTSAETKRLDMLTKTLDEKNIRKLAGTDRCES